jgi:mRNA interferase HigB
VRIIARKTLRDFWARHPDAEQPLKAWYREARLADWKGPDGIKQRYRTASFVKPDRAIFNIGGNKYRLVVAVNYVYKVVYIRFVGTHAQYDRINVSEI